MCFATLERAQDLQTRKETLESESGILREEVVRLRHRLHALEADRSEVIAALR
jgi:phage shock protein A